MVSILILRQPSWSLSIGEIATEDHPLPFTWSAKKAKSFIFKERGPQTLLASLVPFGHFLSTFVLSGFYTDQVAWFDESRIDSNFFRVSFSNRFVSSSLSGGCVGCPTERDLHAQEQLGKEK
jgi:hypothetical protein